ncbi:MAG TPA: hypothetical protein VFN77_00240 [Acetobacteraceae bacterium]|nr:hypothetical protein [Acetobacteraceae bacterium]
MNRYLDLHPTLRRWLWFIGIYAASVIVFAIVAFGLQLLVPK